MVKKTLSERKTFLFGLFLVGALLFIQIKIFHQGLTTILTDTIDWVLKSILFVLIFFILKQFIPNLSNLIEK